MRFILVASLLFCVGVTGCSLTPTATPSKEAGVNIRGNVHGGQQPIVGSHVYLLAANITGYGGPAIPASITNASVSLLNAANTLQSDSIGAYVLSGSDGSFSITGDYNCTPNTQVYLYALGGNPGAGVNSAVGLLATLGNCPAAGSFASTTFVWVNEVSTIAAAYAISGFASDATHVSSSGTALAQVGIANAFANAANLASLSTGAALSTTPAGNGVVPQTEINMLANILASCVNSTGPSSATCSALFTNAPSGGSTSTLPTDTATAAINIAHNPGANLSALFGIMPSAVAFVPTLAYQPNDFSILLAFNGGGLGVSGSSPQALAIDELGDVWVASGFGPIVKFASSGAILSGTNGFNDGTPADDYGYIGDINIAIDLDGNAWTTTKANSVAKISSSGAILSGAGGITGLGGEPIGIAIDSGNDAWIDGPGTYGSIASKISNSGVVLSGTNGYTGGGMNSPIGIGLDGSGSAWIANLYGESIAKLSSSGTAISGSNGFTGGGIGTVGGLALDATGDVWVVSSDNGASLPGGVTKLSNSGSVLFGTSANNPEGNLQQPQCIAIDGAGNAWITNEFPYSYIMQLSNSGTLLSPPNGYGKETFDFPEGIAVDGSGNVWVADQRGYLYELVGAAAPVITPIVAGLPVTPTADGSSNLGTRP
jgi:hypothetical protein